MVKTPSPHERTNRPSRSYTRTGCAPRQKRYTRPVESTATSATSGCEYSAGSCSLASTTSNDGVDVMATDEGYDLGVRSADQRALPDREAPAAECRRIHAALQVDPLIAPGAHGGEDEHPRETRERHGEQRADNAPQLEAEHEREDRSHRMETDGMPGQPREQEVRLDLLYDDERDRDPDDGRKRKGRGDEQRGHRPGDRTDHRDELRQCREQRQEQRVRHTERDQRDRDKKTERCRDHQLRTDIRAKDARDLAEHTPRARAV